MAYNDLDTERINEQLELIAAHIPTIFYMVIVTADGLSTTKWTPDDAMPSQKSIEEDRYMAMSAAHLSLGERVSKEVGCGDYQLSMIRGNIGTIFQFMIDDKYVLSLGMREVKSIDALLATVKNRWDELLRLLDVETPQL